MAFIDQLEDSSEVRRGVKIQVWGGSQTGKSHDAYATLPRPLVVVDADSTAEFFTDERFEGFQLLGLNKIPDTAALIGFLEEFCADPRWFLAYRAILIDSLTVLVDQTVAALKIDVSSQATEKGRGQADFARQAKELNRLLRRVSALGVHVYVVAEERTRFDGSQPAQGEDRGRSSLSPTKFQHPFDLILQKVAPGEVVVHKSRYRKWKKGQRLPRYDARQDLLPILSGEEPKERGLEDFDPATKAHEELMELLKALGSTQRPGGRIPADEMRAYLAVARDNDRPEPEVRKVIHRVRRAYPVGEESVA